VLNIIPREIMLLNSVQWRQTSASKRNKWDISHL